MLSSGEKSFASFLGQNLAEKKLKWTRLDRNEIEWNPIFRRSKAVLPSQTAFCAEEKSFSLSRKWCFVFHCFVFSFSFLAFFSFSKALVSLLAHDSRIAERFYAKKNRELLWWECFYPKKKKKWMTTFQRNFEIQSLNAALRRTWEIKRTLSNFI